MIEIVSPYLLYVVAIGFPAFFVLRWLYSQWWKANLPAFWAWVLQQRRRDKVIRVTRERVVDLEQRLAALEKNVGGLESADEENSEREGVTEGLADALLRIGTVERMVAQLRHRLRSKGIMIDG